MLWLMVCNSCIEAAQAPRRRNPLNGGGPVVGSAGVESEFEFTAINPGGGSEKSMVST